MIYIDGNYYRVQRLDAIVLYPPVNWQVREDILARPDILPQDAVIGGTRVTYLQRETNLTGKEEIDFVRALVNAAIDLRESPPA